MRCGGGLPSAIESSKHRLFRAKNRRKVTPTNGTAVSRLVAVSNGTKRPNPLVASPVFPFKLSVLCILRIVRAHARANDVEVNKMANTGNNNPGNFSNDPDKASEAGKKGGEASGGNFANDPQRASEAGQKGGQASGGQPSRDKDSMSGGGQGTNRGGEFADDKENMSKPGQKGGQASGGQQSNKADQSSSGGQGSGRGGNFADDRDKSSGTGRNDDGMSGGGGRKS